MTNSCSESTVQSSLESIMQTTGEAEAGDLSHQTPEDVSEAAEDDPVIPSPEAESVLLYPGVSGASHWSSERTMLADEIKCLRQERDTARKERDELQTRLDLAQLSARMVENDDRKCKYYTGITWDVYNSTFEFLQSELPNKGIPKLSYVDQFFLTLVKLKHNPKFEYLCNQAGLTHPSTMVDYFWKWVDLMHTKLNFMVTWPDRDIIYKTIPPDMKEKFPRLTSIIDCFEIFTETPGQLKAHAQCYSNYKKHTTVKFLIACSPLGAVTFLSNAYGGRISDVNVVRDSGFLSHAYHQPGDQILADRGFTMKDEFGGLLGVELITPAFIKGKAQFSACEVHQSRFMSSVRIHIERVIGQLKQRFAILQGVIPIRFVKSLKDEVEEVDNTSIDKVVRCCAVLTNLSDSIVYRE